MVYQKTARRPPEDCQKTSRRPPEDCQKTARRLPEDHQKLLAVFWQSSNTIIQGNFYKKLHFYMNSCAISPMASFFVEYTKKKTSVFQIQLEFWVNITLYFWLMYPPPPGKVGFCLSYNFSNLFPPKWLRMTWNGQFRPICNFSNLFPTEVAQNDSEWPISPDSQLFQYFPTEVAQNDLEWPIFPNSQLFQSFPTKVAQNDSEQPILHGQNKIHSDTMEFL